MDGLKTIAAFCLAAVALCGVAFGQQPPTEAEIRAEAKANVEYLRLSTESAVAMARLNAHITARAESCRGKGKVLQPVAGGLTCVAPPPAAPKTEDPKKEEKK